MRSRWKRGAERNALGRSRGGFSTKINARTNAEGLPIGVVITPGQAHDVTAFPALMQEIDCDPEQMLGDKGYDSEAVRNDIEERGGEAAIPSTATRKIQHAVDKALYALRNRIERFFNRAKNSRRVATRYDKLIESFAAFVLLACIQNSGLSLSTRPSRGAQFPGFSMLLSGDRQCALEIRCRVCRVRLSARETTKGHGCRL